MTLTYCGTHDAVDLYDPRQGVELASDIKKGDSVDVPDYMVAELLERGDWKKARSRKRGKEE